MLGFRERGRRVALSVVAAGALLLGACGGGGGGGAGDGGTGGGTGNGSGSGTPLVGTDLPEPTLPAAVGTVGLSGKATLGQTIFLDGGLSASGSLSCATCHSPTRGFVATVAIALGGLDRDLANPRHAPTLSYLAWAPAFHLGSDGRLRGGFNRDGREATFASQAHRPLEAPFEMANTDPATMLARVKTRPWVDALSAQYGAAVLDSGTAATDAIADALQAYQLESVTFRSFDSKYDRALAGETQLTAREANGLKLFTDPAKGNCASCHTATGNAAHGPLFTDHSYAALGVPRNWAIPYNQPGATLPAFVPANGRGAGEPDYAYYDMGLCGPFRTDRSGIAADCGKFKTPTLRNAAIKRAFFHNGVLTTLQDVVRFKVTRDLSPLDWYRKADGTPDIAYNDLPVAYQGNVHRGAPFRASGQPALSAGEINDVVLFMCALVDGWRPDGAFSRNLQPAAYCTDALNGPGGL